MDFRCAAAGLLCKAVDNPNFGVPCIECNKVAHAECGESFYNQSTTNITANQLSSQARVLVDVYAQSPDNAQLCVNCIIDIQRRIAANNNTQAATATATGATMGNGTSTNYSTPVAIPDTAEGTTDTTANTNTIPIPIVPTADNAMPIQHGMSEAQMTEFKRLFYAQLDMKYAARSSSTSNNGGPKFLTKEQYDESLEIVQSWVQGVYHTPKEVNANKKYVPIPASHDSSLRLRERTTSNSDTAPQSYGLKIVQKHNMFDIILRQHAKVLRHSVDSRPIHTSIKSEYYGIVEADIKLFVTLCPICLASRNVITAKQAPLCMIISETVGKRGQMDLLDFTSSPDPVTGDKWILRLSDHHSGYGQVRALQNKTAHLTSIGVIQILCSMPVFEILQSDNGGEFYLHQSYAQMCYIRTYL